MMLIKFESSSVIFVIIFRATVTRPTTFHFTVPGIIVQYDDDDVNKGNKWVTISVRRASFIEKGLRSRVVVVYQVVPGGFVSDPYLEEFPPLSTSSSVYRMNRGPATTM